MDIAQGVVTPASSADPEMSREGVGGEPDVALARRMTVSSLLHTRASACRGLWPRRRSPRRRAAVEPLLEVFHRQHPTARTEVEWLRRAYSVAEFLHAGQMRKSGAPYITHPLAVATILAELGMDAATLVAALLHDTVEDTEYTLGECRADFGSEVAYLVDGVTKLDGRRLGKQVAEPETFRKLVLAAGADVRVLLIKLVDRLHNLRTLGAQPAHKQARIARQSMELLVPFCDRLGLYRLKRELEDLAFRYLQPEDYQATITALAAVSSAGREYFDQVVAELSAALRQQQIAAWVDARPRHVFSVYSDNRERLDGLSPARVCRVIVVVNGTTRDCWIALGAVHQWGTPVAGRLRDWIAAPKYNLYQSLHTSVLGPDGHQLDVVIRTNGMQEVAEDGIAATIRETSRTAGHAAAGATARHRGDLEWLQRLLAWQHITPPEQYLDELRTELRGGSIAVVATTGELVTLPRGASGVDFAYTRGVAIGNRLVALRVNGRLAPVTVALHNGDLVEVITGDHAQPSPDWLAAARTAQARRSLRGILELDTAHERDLDDNGEPATN